MELALRIMRHGEARYTQKEVSFEEAYDLTEKGIIDVDNMFNMMNRDFQKGSTLEVWVSPYGRTQHTLKIGKESLRQRNLKSIDCKIVSELSEVRNFEWDLFLPLVTGGNVEYKGRNFVVNPILTNPQSLPYGVFFNHDLMHKLSRDAVNSLPEEYLARLNTIERATDVKRRARQIMSKALSYSNADNLLLVTHDGLAGPIVSDYTKGLRTSLKPAGYLTLRKFKDKFNFVEITEPN